MRQIGHIRTSVLDIAYEESGPVGSLPVVLLHGYPYDARAFDEVVPVVNTAGFRTIVPYLRGYGTTTFLSPDTLRSGEQAALGKDLLELLDALRIRQAVLAGFDWGGRAACIVSALWPERVRGLVTCTGYQIQDIANSDKPADPEQERRFWYQYYFHTERGRKGLAQMRGELGRLLWKLWSPTWAFDDATYDQSATSFENTDFVDVVIHSYRHRTGNAAGDPRYASIEAQLATLPKINVPTIVIHGAVDDVNPPQKPEGHQKYFTGHYQRRLFENVGHNPPQEAPRAFAEAIMDICNHS
ncbi:MAG: alpha/beta hydrolase [Beijerinckiaceae bacterium]